MESTIISIVEAIDVEKEIIGSFDGSLSTQKLVDHFSSLTITDECMSNYTSYCYSKRGWKRKVDIGNGKAKSASGWQALAKWSAMILLSELSLWSEELSVTDRNALVKKHWLQFNNVVAQKCFRNAIVFNNMASLRSNKKAIKADVKDLEDLPESVEKIIETVKAEESTEQQLELVKHLSEIRAKFDSCKTLADYKNTVQWLDIILESFNDKGITALESASEESMFQLASN